MKACSSSVKSIVIISAKCKSISYTHQQRSYGEIKGTKCSTLNKQTCQQKNFGSGVVLPGVCRVTENFPKKWSYPKENFCFYGIDNRALHHPESSECTCRVEKRVGVAVEWSECSCRQKWVGPISVQWSEYGCRVEWV